MSKLVQYIGSDQYEFEIYVFVNRNSITKLYAMEHSIQRGMGGKGGGGVSWSVF